MNKAEKSWQNWRDKKRRDLIDYSSEDKKAKGTTKVFRKKKT